jgi:hypothetical protein
MVQFSKLARSDSIVSVAMQAMEYPRSLSLFVSVFLSLLLVVVVSCSLYDNWLSSDLASLT